MRKVQFANGEYYHIYNRGVDKRSIFEDGSDLQRLLQSVKEFNTVEAIGSIYANQFQRRKLSKLRGSTPKFVVGQPQGEKLVNVVCYCFNPNHFHMILEQAAERGIEKFMHKVGGGYTTYFNTKYSRNGALFQGRYKAVHIDSDPHLLHASVYVNLNNRVHKIDRGFIQSSWEEYVAGQEGLCTKEIILNQFKNPADYKEFAENSLLDILERKKILKDIERFELE